MSNVLTLQSKKLNLYELVLGLGLSVNNYPRSPSDCFSYKGKSKEEEKIFRERKVSSITTLIKQVFPKDKPLSGKYSDSRELVRKVIEDARYPKRAAMQYASDIVETGIDKLIGFYLVKELEEGEDYPAIMEMRKVILAVRDHTKVSIRAAKKGPNTEEVVESSLALIQSQGIRLITNEFCIAIQDYLIARKYLDGDDRVDKLLEQLARDNQKFLPRPKNNEDIQE